MKPKSGALAPLAALCLTALPVTATPCRAQAAGAEGLAAQITAVEALQAKLEAQQQALEATRRRLEAQERELERQRQELSAQQIQLHSLVQQLPARPVAEAVAPSGLSELAGGQSGETAPAAAPPTPAARSVGEPPEARERSQEIAVLADEGGGVLTPPGVLVLEPQVDYSYDSDRLFAFRGIELIPAFLVGVIDVSDVQRNTITTSLTARYGISSRFEAEVKVPLVYRSDRLENLELRQAGETAPLQLGLAEPDTFGIGDIEFGGHYQITDGLGGWPVLIGNLQVKTTTGTNPFEVDLDEELNTGSGFWSLQPSVTAILPSDPAVIFGNFGYTWNIKRDIDEQLESTLGEIAEIGEVDPGDALSGTLGLGFAFNERTSVSFGYSHDWVFETETEVNGEVQKSRDLQVGSFLFGISHRLDEMTTMNFNVEVGATEDAPDVRVALRVPIWLTLFR